jgi:hypothetical protein
VLALAASSGLAQEQAVSMPRGDTTLSFGIGLAVGATEAGAALGLGVDHLVANRLSLQVAVGYLDRGLRAQAWTAHAGVRLDLADKGADTTPFLALGAGVYHASFDRIGYGMSLEGGAACMGATGAAACYADMPRFYAQRMWSDRGTWSDGGRTWWPPRREFTDPTVVVGAGVRWNVTPQLAVVPDARALLVFGDGDSDALGIFTLNVAYRF